MFAGSYGWKSPGKIHNCQTLLRRMLNLTGSYTNSAGDYSTGAAQVILPYVSGSIEVYEQCTTWKNLAENCELMVLWGCNPMNNSQISWQIADHGAWPGIELVKKAGVKVLSIDPVLTETCEALNGEWLAPRPHTDVAMMLGIAHTLYVEGLHDQKFLDRYTTGFDKFLPYLLGKSDGTPKSADWAAQICGLPADTLRELARRFAKHRTMLALGYSTQRQQHGEQIHWMLITLASMLGQIGLPGGGYGLSYHYSSGGAPTRTTPILKAIDDASGQKQEGAAWLAGGGAVSILVSRLVETLLNPGKTMQFNGHDIKLPLLKLAYWVGGNPFSHQQDRNEMLRAWRELDTFIVHDVQWTATARHADIVLPATTSYERNDIEQVGDYAISHIVPMKKIVEPLFEARNDFDIFADIAAKLGKGYEFTQGRDEMDWIRGLYEAAKIESRAKGWRCRSSMSSGRATSRWHSRSATRRQTSCATPTSAPTRCSTPWVPPRAGSSCIREPSSDTSTRTARPMPAGSSRSSASTGRPPNIRCTLPPITRRCACIRSCAAPSIARAMRSPGANPA